MIKSLRTCTLQSILFLSALLGSIAQADAVTQEKNDETLCQRLPKLKTPHAVLTDENWIEVKAKIDLGVIDTFTAKRTSDFRFSARKYRLILSPERIVVSDVCTMSMCVETKKVRPKCPVTSEYLLSFSLVASTFGAGEFSTEVKLDLEDPDSEYPLGIDALSGREIVGSISMPWLEVRESKVDTTTIKKFTEKQVTEITFHLLNSGDRPVQLGSWEKVDGSHPDIDLKESTCSTKPIAPKETCIVKLVMRANSAPPGKHAWWMNSSKDERNTFTLYADFDKDSSLSVTIRNR
jgi:hypothetical protein